MAITHEERRALLEPFGLAEAIGEPLAMPADLGPEVVISPDDQNWSRHFVTVKVRGVEHLKQLTGIPSDVAASAEASGHYQVPVFGGSQIADKAMTALFGDWTGSLSHDGSAKEVEEFMMAAASELPVFATTDLVVKDGETYTLKDAPTFYFDSITVYGTGGIVTKGQLKIISDSVAYLPALHVEETGYGDVHRTRCARRARRYRAVGHASSPETD
jgi:hypothetical protein